MATGPHFDNESRIADMMLEPSDGGRLKSYMTSPKVFLGTALLEWYGSSF